ncbi:MAG: sodium:proton antiporter [Rickettsiales bacterium]|nr:sodium:proton antiporter [Rickettsiales bacterium]|tara:strand:- start:3024 stop:3425 length:402 start_codon:yes stop_codon:yes gene_type:complete
MAAVDMASWFLLLSGAAFCIIGGIGLLRMPDFYARTHAAGVTDTLGAGLLLAGLLLQAGPTLIGVKLVLIFAFLELVGPTAGHALFKAAYADGIKVHVGEDVAEQVAAESAAATAISAASDAPEAAAAEGEDA